ncbi:MAG: leucine-rich repeat protein, partial [Verrucomicrobia bacterium]|nr:leucine-rich repeat protein [Verrucomicrobiota bacterium]
MKPLTTLSLAIAAATAALLAATHCFFPGLLLATGGAGGRRRVPGRCHWLAPLLLLCCMANPLVAAQFGDFTYTDNGTSITITDYPSTAVGVVEIPASIVGKPVTQIGDFAFQDCGSLTGVTIPAGVTHIGSFAFQNNSSLTSLTLPASLSHIGDFAFHGCGNLTGITLPGGVISIGNYAFYRCSRLLSASFTGNAPTLGTKVFQSAAVGFTVYYFTSTTGFTSPTWQGYPAVGMARVPMDYVTIGNPGNAADPATGYGAVSYEYSIAKNETTIGQYCGFLNAVAKTDPYSLYNPSMASDATIAGITRSGVSGSYTYAVVPGSGNKPITFVSWFDAARFCNWLHNGQGSGSTETGAYTLNGAMSGIIMKEAAAKVWIPSENEWYKAAYYDPTKGGSNYWLYPTQSDTLAGNTIGVAHSANYHDGDFVGYPGMALTDGGAYGANSDSFYATSDQGGNVWEWNDAVIGSSRGLRGGSWFNPATDQASSSRFAAVSTSLEDSTFGFRVASVAAPAADILTFGLQGNPAVITGANISLTVPYGTDVTSLAPTFTLSTGATCDRTSGATQDFTAPRLYTVTSSDSLITKVYTVTVTVSPADAANANLGNLVLSAGTLSPVFDAATVSYSAKVASTVAGLTVTPTVAAA